MSTRKSRRIAFRPSVTESRLEERLVLAGGAGMIAEATSNPAVIALVSSVTSPGLTPPPAASPISPAALARASQPLTLARLQTGFNQQARAATRDLRTAIQAQVGQLFANGATPTAQQMADFNVSIAGALDATSLRLSTQAALLPHAGSRLVPAIQNAILGSGPRSLVNRLGTLVQSGQLSGTTGVSSQALTRLFNTTNHQAISHLNNFFTTTPVNRLSVNSSGQRIPLQQFMGNQLLNQVANTFGSLAQSFPGVANSILFPNGATGTPSQAALNTFNTMVNNALGTAAFQLGSGLSVFPGSSGVISQLQPLLFGSTNSPVNSVASSAGTGINSIGGTFNPSASSAGTGIAGNTFNSLVSALQGLPFGSTGFNTAANNAFGTAFQNLVTPLGQFFGMTGQSNLSLPTSGLSSPFGSAFAGSSFFNGFNNGFASGTTPGFIGFGTAPTSFNTNFGTGFNNMVSNFNTGVGFQPGSTGILPGSFIQGPNGQPIGATF